MWQTLLACGLAAWLGWAAEARAAAAAGEVLYRAACETCHGVSGEGDGPAAADMYLKPRSFRVGQFKFDTDADGSWGSDVDLANVIRNGAARYGGSVLMAPWGGLSTAEVNDLIAFIRSLKE